MSWLGLRYKTAEILLPHEWNSVIDGLDILKAYVDDLYNKYKEVDPAEEIYTFKLSVSTTPTNIPSYGFKVKGVHIKVPSTVDVLYVGNKDRQDLVLEGKDILSLRVKKPENIYVKALKDVVIYIALETGNE